MYKQYVVSYDQYWDDCIRSVVPSCWSRNLTDFCRQVREGRKTPPEQDRRARSPVIEGERRRRPTRGNLHRLEATAGAARDFEGERGTFCRRGTPRASGDPLVTRHRCLLPTRPAVRGRPRGCEGSSRASEVPRGRSATPPSHLFFILVRKRPVATTCRLCCSCSWFGRFRPNHIHRK